MATRASARLAVLSPPPLQLAPPTSPTSTTMTSGKGKVPISSVEWTKDKLEELNIHITPTSELTSIIPAAFTSQDLVITPEELVSETSNGSTADGDYLIRAFFDTLGMIQTMLSGNEERKTIPGVEGYTAQLLSDFVRVLFLANKSVLGKCERGQAQICPPGQMSFDINGVRNVVLHDGSVSIFPEKDNAYNVSADILQALPITFEARHSQLNGDEALERDGQIVAQLLGSLLNTAFSLWGKEAFVFHIDKMKVYVYHGQFSTKFLQQLLDGGKVTEPPTINRYPKDGFDLADPKQRQDAFTTMFRVFAFSISDKAKIASVNQSFKPPGTHTPVKEIVVINAPISEGEKILSSLPTPPPRMRSPRRQSPRRSASPKRASSPKRKHNPELELGSESPRPSKRTATVDAVVPAEDPKPIKLNSFGFGAKISSSPWTIPAKDNASTTPEVANKDIVSTSDPSKSSQPTSSQPPAKKTFGFGMASTGASPFAAVAQSTSAWSGWETQKSTTFESKPLFSTPSKPAPPPLPPRKEESKKQEANEKKSNDNEFSDDDDDDVEDKYEDGDDDPWDADPESQLENGDDSEKPSKKNIDMREQAGEAHEETLFETTCTLYETDPKTSSWVSKGTGIIHVNIDKNSGASPKNSRLIMRQQGTMKVMWNIRLFKGMQLLPRQVSDGDRRMDVYVKMVLVDDGHPKSYAIKLRNHTIMDELYAAIKRAIPK